MTPTRWRLSVSLLDHPVLTVRSIPATCDFCTRVLGMREVSASRGRTAWRSAGRRSTSTSTLTP